MVAIKVCVIFLTVLSAVNSARILGIFHMPAYSHFQLGDRIFKELASRGHEVTVISPYELKTPVKNLKHVVITGLVEEIEGIKKNLFEESGNNVFTTVFKMDLYGLYFSETVLNHTNVQKLLKSNEKFDLIIQQSFLNEAFYGFSHYYKAPTLLISPIGNCRWTTGKMGNPSNPAYVPDVFLSYSSHMNIFERAFNTLVYIVGEISSHLITHPKHNQLLQKYFPGSPCLYDLMYNTSLVLLNSHTSINSPVPLLPNLVEIGGYHVQPPKPLPKDLKDYLDNAKEGFIYFSLGSNLKSKDLPTQKRDEILKVLGKLKYKVLWKWETDVLPGQPPNVKLGKWLPQQDILAHPNIKLFITHGGLLSTIEAIYHGVPVLGIPVFGDQKLNIVNAEHSGYGIGVPYQTLNEVTLSTALDEILTNKKYRENAKMRSKLMHDQAVKPLDLAMYWIEYVIRHHGAPHLKTAALSLNWYQYLLLDVIAAVTVALSVFLWIFYKIGKCLLKMTCNKKPPTDKNKKRN